MEANDIIRDIRKLSPTIFFPPCAHVVNAVATTFSDASFNISSRKSYGQTGVVSGVRAELSNEINRFYALEWISVKQRRIFHSSYGAEILACADGDDKSYFLRMAMRSLFTSINMRNELIGDPMGLYDTISTLHEGSEYCLRQTVTRIRDSFGSGDLDVLKWISGVSYIADALMKRNKTLWKLLNNVTASGFFPKALDATHALGSHEWN